MTNLRMIDTFSGIGGFSLAARWLGGIETVAFVEREPFCQRILAKHWPSVPIHDDICTFNPEPGSADIVCGGFPCQDISQAGKGAGLAGSRSGLFYELLRVVRLVGPRYVVLENVAAITYRGMDDVLGTLAEAGYDAEWACIPAAAVGACHQRDRWWCVAYSQDMLSHGGPGQQQGQLGGRAVPEPGDGDRADAADAERGPAQLRRSAGELAGQEGETEGQGHQRERGRLALGGSGETAHAHHQRQQECQPAAITSGAGRACWPHAPRQLNPDWRSYLSEPVLCRGDDGVSGRVHRLKALGNAVVPQVAMIPLARVLELAQQPAPGPVLSSDPCHL
jgi:DNA (cytosine-5)-methyltransferase 1